MMIVVLRLRRPLYTTVVLPFDKLERARRAKCGGRHHKIFLEYLTSKDTFVVEMNQGNFLSKWREIFREIFRSYVGQYLGKYLDHMWEDNEGNWGKKFRTRDPRNMEDISIKCRLSRHIKYHRLDSPFKAET